MRCIDNRQRYTYLAGTWMPYIVPMLRRFNWKTQCAHYRHYSFGFPCFFTFFTQHSFIPYHNTSEYIFRWFAFIWLFSTYYQNGRKRNDIQRCIKFNLVSYMLMVQNRLNSVNAFRMWEFEIMKRKERNNHNNSNNNNNNNNKTHTHTHTTYGVSIQQLYEVKRE